MARHRNVRNLNYDDMEYDDVFGHSVEEDCISPTDAQQWIYDRARGQSSMTEFLSNHTDIQEEDELDMQDEMQPKYGRRDSENFKMPQLEEVEQTKLLSCMDEIRSIVGDSVVSDKQMVDTIMKYNYDCSKALDELLNQCSETPNKTTIATPKKQEESVEIGNKIVDYEKIFILN